MNYNFKLLQTLLKNNKFRVSFLKYFAGAASTALVAFAVYGIVSYNLYTMHLRDTLSQYRERSLYKTSGVVDYVFESVDRALYLICNTPGYQKLLNALSDALPDSVPEDGRESEELVKRSDVARVIDALFMETVHSPAMDSIYIYSEINGHVVTWTDFRPVETFFDPDFLEVYYSGNSFFTHERNTGPGASRVITLIREVTMENRAVGVAAFNINYEQFASYINQGFENLPEMVCVADNAGRIFYATDPALLNTSIQDHPMYGTTYAGAVQGGSSVMFTGGYVVSAVLAHDGNYSVVSAVEATDIANFRYDFVRFAIWASLIGLLITFFIAFGISYRLYRNVIRLVSYIDAPYGHNASPDERGEAKYITENITGLAARNSYIEHELAEKLAELKKAQAIALQNQINPHFILNTLQIVNLDILSQLKTDSAATRIIALLSDILQSNLNTTDHIVPLSYEIRQAAKYVEIERIRRKERFMIDWDVDESLMKYRTVKFIIQPVLENSFKHGLTDSQRVSVQVEIEDKTLVIVISDNSIGMPPETLSDLQRRLQQSHIQENRHIGLCNVDKRIKLVFGDSFGVSVNSTYGSGTTVTIRQKLIHDDWT